MLNVKGILYMSGSMETNLLNSGDGSKRVTYKDLELEKWIMFRRECKVRMDIKCEITESIFCEGNSIGMDGCPLWYTIKNQHLA